MQQTAAFKLREMLEPQLRLRGLLSHEHDWIPLKGGRTNWLWRVSGTEGDVVVKLYSGATTNPLFPNDPDSEVLVLQHLLPQGIAPRLVDHFRTDAGYCLVYAHVTGLPWTVRTASAAKVLYRLHQIAPPPGLRLAPDGSHALSLQTQAILDVCPADRARSLRGFEPAGAVAPSRRSSLLHADPVPANMIDHAGALRLIDWQCPAIGDPCEDLSVFLSPAMQITYRGTALSDDEKAAFLSAYSDRATVGRYRRLAPWYHWRMAAYCLWQESHGDPQAATAGAAEIDALRLASSEQH